MTTWPLNKPLLVTTNLEDVEASARVWESATPAQLRACWQGPLSTAAVLRATLDDRRLELLALRLASAYQDVVNNLSPKDVFGHEVLADLCGPFLSSASKEEGCALKTAGWQMRNRARYSRSKVSPASKVASLLQPSWVDNAGDSWLSTCGPVIYRRFKTGVVVDLKSLPGALACLMTREHDVRRRVGVLEAAFPQVPARPPMPRM